MKIIDAGDGFYNAIVQCKPQKRTIKWQGKPVFADFNFYTTFIIPFYKHDNVFIKHTASFIGAMEKETDDIIYPFRFPHLGPNNMKFCVYHKPNMLFFNNFENVAKLMTEIFWCSNNTSYMKDDFTLIKNEFSQPTLSKIGIPLLSTKKINLLNIDFSSNLLYHAERFNEINAVFNFLSSKKIYFTFNSIQQLMRSKNCKIYDLVLNHTENAQQQSILNSMFKYLLILKDTKSLNYLFNKPNVIKYFNEFVNLLILSFHNNEIIKLLNNIKLLYPQHLNTELIKKELVSDPTNNFLKTLID